MGASWSCSSGSRRRLLAAVLFALLPLALVVAEDLTVSWTDTVNVSTVNGSLQKTSGCDGCDDAGAASQQALMQGDGFVEFTVGEDNTLWAAGFSHADGDTTYLNI